MPCPICSHTMHNLGIEGEQKFWCPRCGTTTTVHCNGMVNTAVPALVDRVVRLRAEMTAEVGFAAWDQRTWHRLGILEAISSQTQVQALIDRVARRSHGRAPMDWSRARGQKDRWCTVTHRLMNRPEMQVRLLLGPMDGCGVETRECRKRATCLGPNPKSLGVSLGNSRSEQVAAGFLPPWPSPWRA